jgi:hypothetical protein
MVRGIARLQFALGGINRAHHGAQREPHWARGVPRVMAKPLMTSWPRLSNLNRQFALARIVLDQHVRSFKTPSYCTTFMKREILALFVASIVVAGPAEVTHGERTNSAVNFFEHAGAVKAGVSFGFGEHAMSRTMETQTMFIRHTATELQRRTAEKNAKAYYAHLTPKKKADLKAKKIRYILVPTVKSPETSPQAKEVRMTWDTQSESLADKYVYEFANPPAAGTVAMVGGHTAEYAALH